jgi:hypothetical protein
VSINVRSFSIEVGSTQVLDQAQGEDTEYRLTFTSGGAAIDFSGAQTAVMSVRDRSGQLIFARTYSGFVGGDATLGGLRFQVLAADTEDESVQAYDLDVSWTDASGYKRQLLRPSRFLVLLGVGQSGDTPSSPPAIPGGPGFFQVTDVKTTGYGASWWQCVQFNPIATGFTMVAPNAVGYTGHECEFKNSSTGFNPVTVMGMSGQKIDGATMYLMNTAFESLRLRSNGTGLMVIG